MEKKINVSVDDTMLKFSGGYDTGQVMEYANTFVNLSCLGARNKLRFSNGRQFGVIHSSEWINQRHISTLTGRPVSSSPRVEVVINLLPEFVIAIPEGKDRSVVSLVRSVKLSWEMEGWRMVSSPKIELLSDEILIEVSQSLGKMNEVENLEVNTIG